MQGLDEKKSDFVAIFFVFSIQLSVFSCQCSVISNQYSVFGFSDDSLYLVNNLLATMRIDAD